MGYTKQTWVNNDPSKPLDANRLNHIEDGVFVAEATADSAAGGVTALNALTTSGRLSEDALNTTIDAAIAATVPAAELSALRRAVRAGQPALSDFARRVDAYATAWADPNVWRVRAMTKQGRRLVGVKHDSTNGLSIGYSDNDGTTWTSAYQWAVGTATVSGSLVVTNDGEIVIAVWTSAGNYDCKVYRSTGFDTNPATATWALVFDTPFAQAATGPSGIYRGFAYDGQNTIAGAWYDAKTLVGATVYGNNAGVRVRVAVDKGVTWAEVFNLWSWLTAQGVNPDAYGYHVHSILYDYYSDGWVLSYGDTSGSQGECGILHFTKDFQTITVLYRGIGPWQAVGMYSLPDCILTSGDGGISGGVNRFPRLADGTFGAPEKAYTLDNSIGTCGYQDGPGSLVLIPLTQISGTTPLSRLLATADGYVFRELIVDPSYTVSSLNGLQFVVGPTVNGAILATSVNDGRYAGSTSQLKIAP